MHQIPISKEEGATGICCAESAVSTHAIFLTHAWTTGICVWKFGNGRSTHVVTEIVGISRVTPEIEAASGFKTSGPEIEGAMEGATASKNEEGFSQRRRRMRTSSESRIRNLTTPPYLTSVEVRNLESRISLGRTQN